MKFIEDEIQFDIPEGWSWCRLKDIAAPKENSFVDGPFGSNLKTEHYTNKKEVRIIQLNNIGEFCWKNSGTKYTTFMHADTIKRCKTYPGDIVIAKMMPAGRAIIVPNVEKEYVISSDCVRLRTSKEVDVEFIMYMLNSSFVIEQIAESIHGIGRSRTSLTKLRNLIVPIPSLNEQKLIVKNIIYCFGLINSIQDKKDELLNLSAILKSKVLNLAIRGKLVPQDPNDVPASVLLERIKAEKEELIKQGKIKRDKKESVIFKGDDNSYYEKVGNEAKNIDAEVPFNLPENWLWVRLNTIAINFDSSRKPINSAERKKRMAKKEKHLLYPYYGSTGQVGFIDDYIFDGKYVLLGEDAAPFLDKAASKAYIVNGKVWVNNHVHILKSLISSEYLLCCLNSVDYTDYVYGTTRLKLTQENMNKIIIPVPPLNEQNRISKAIDMLSANLRKIEESIN